MNAPLDDDRLQKYFDGELPDEEMSAIREILEGSEEAQHRLDALSRLRDLIKLNAEAAGDDLDADAMFSDVQIGMHTGQSMRVIQGGKAETRDPPKTLEAWRLAVPALAVAIAAAVLFAVFGPGQSEDESVADDDTRIEETPVLIIEDEHSEGLVHVEPPHGSEVVEVDFGDNTGTVFAVEGDAGEPIAVVWISDEPLEEVTQ